MTDDESGLPTDQLNADGTRVPQTSTTNIGAYMWSAVAARAARADRPARAGRSGSSEDADHARAHGALRRHRPVLQLVRPPDGREAHDLAADRRAAHADPLLGRQRAGSRSGCGSCATPCRSSPRARARCTTAWTSASTTSRRGTRSCSTTCRRPARSRAATTRSSRRAGSRTTSGSRRASCRPTCTTGRVRTFPETCAGSFQETRPEGFTRTYGGRSVFEGSLSVRRHAARAELGREHVRGADAGAVRPRGALGPGQLGGEPPEHDRRADRPRH